MVTGAQDDPGQQREAVLRAFLDEHGRLRSIPVKRSKRLVLLDRVAQAFEIGERYPEREVGVLLRAFHDDVAALRRHLVDEGMMTRSGGVYWRSGGSVQLQQPEPHRPDHEQP